MEAVEPFASLAVALGVGLLIGFERERSGAPEGKRELTAGARTFPLLSLAGALSAMVSKVAGPWVIAVGLLAALGPLLLSYAADLRRGEQRGGTSVAAAVVVFFLGVLTQADTVLPLRHRLSTVGSLGVVVALLLSVKLPLHAFAHRVSRDDVYATLKFLVVAVVVLPLLPDQTFGPLDVINPFEVGLMIVLIAGLGFVGFIAMRALGPNRGLAVTGLVGGLASSTAVTLTLSGRARTEPTLARGYAIAVVLASCVMFLRVLLEIAVVNRDLLAPLLAPFALMAGTGALLAAGLLWQGAKGRRDDDEITLKNPVELGTAVKFGLLYAGVLVASKGAMDFVGPGGTYVAALVAGATDADAITLSMARLARTTLDDTVAARAIFIGAASNTAAKAVLAVVLGGWAFGRVVLGCLAVSIAAGALGLFLL